VARTTHDRGYQYFPAFLDLARKRVVVIGGGAVAASKVASLLPCGADPVVVVAPDACSVIVEYAAAGRLQWVAREYVENDLAGAALAFGATNDRSVNAQVADEARRRGILVLAVDDVQHCDFIAPALVRRGDLVLAISTHGRSPALARRTREWLDASLPPHWGALLDVAAIVRQRLRALHVVAQPEDWQSALSGPVEDLVRIGQLEAAADLLYCTLTRLCAVSKDAS
jgi:precorrin-2 dehydrogenase